MPQQPRMSKLCIVYQVQPTLDRAPCKPFRLIHTVTQKATAQAEKTAKVRTRPCVLLLPGESCSFVKASTTTTVNIFA